MKEAQKTILTVDGAAAFTGLSKRYIYKLVHYRKIPHYKPQGGGRLYFRINELEEYLLHDQRTVGSERGVAP